MTLTREEEAAFAMVGTYFNKQLELLTAFAPALEEMHVVVKRAEVKVKMKHKRPHLRRTTAREAAKMAEKKKLKAEVERLSEARKASWERSLGVKL
jgi:hypothetical protein